MNYIIVKVNKEVKVKQQVVKKHNINLVGTSIYFITTLFLIILFLFIHPPINNK